MPAKKIKKCFLVFGPESSGTRLMTRLLIDWGCEGEDTHPQMMDDIIWWRALISLRKDKQPTNLVWRRSMPHGGIWPDPAMMLRRLEDCGYQPHFVFTLRSKTPCVASQMKIGHVRTREEGEFKVLQAMHQITGYAISFKVPYSLVTYEGLVHQPALRKALCEELGLRWWNRRLTDENRKHLG